MLRLILRLIRRLFQRKAVSVMLILWRLRKENTVQFNLGQKSNGYLKFKDAAGNGTGNHGAAVLSLSPDEAFELVVIDELNFTVEAVTVGSTSLIATVTNPDGSQYSDSVTLTCVEPPAVSVEIQLSSPATP